MRQNQSWQRLGLVLSLALALLALLAFLLGGLQIPLLVITFVFLYFAFTIWRRLQQG